MRNLILLAAAFHVVVLCLSGCEIDETIQAKRDTQAKEQAVLKQVMADVPYRRACHYRYKGHEYIKFSGSHGADTTTVHDPDCYCRLR